MSICFPCSSLFLPLSCGITVDFWTLTVHLCVNPSCHHASVCIPSRSLSITERNLFSAPVLPSDFGLSSQWPWSCNAGRLQNAQRVSGSLPRDLIYILPPSVLWHLLTLCSPLFPSRTKPAFPIKPHHFHASAPTHTHTHTRFNLYNFSVCVRRDRRHLLQFKSPFILKNQGSSTFVHKSWSCKHEHRRHL